MKKILSIFVSMIVILSSVVSITAISMVQEYSDNVQRYVIRTDNKKDIINKNITVTNADKFSLKYRVGSKYKSATYSSSNNKIATINQSGKVSFKKDGNVTIKIKCIDGRIINQKFKVANTKVVVSIKNQTAKLYVKGKVVRSAKVVTGMAGRTPTPKGTFKIAYKQRDTFLDGSTVGYDYYLAVKYWVPLANTGGVGLHDASWRSNNAFGSNYYKFDGSHGCINMRTKDIAYFFKYLKAGDLVIIK